MSKSYTPLPSDLQKALDDTGLPWEIEYGKKHRKIILAGEFIAIIPLGRLLDNRGARNTLAAVKRKAKELARRQA